MYTYVKWNKSFMAYFRKKDWVRYIEKGIIFIIKGTLFLHCRRQSEIQLGVPPESPQKVFEISAILIARKRHFPSYHWGYYLNKIHKKSILHVEVFRLPRTYYKLVNKELQEKNKRRTGKYYLSEQL